MKIKQQLNDYSWVDENDALHIDVPALLHKMNVADTLENREAASKIAVEFVARETDAVVILTP